MLRNLFFASAIAALTLLPYSSLAGGGGGHGGGGGGGSYGGPHGPGGAPHGFGGGIPHGVWGGERHEGFGGRFDRGHFDLNHERHFWRGRWWSYGVGECWALDRFGRYVWVCE